MNRFLEKFDEFAAPCSESKTVLWLDRIAFALLFLFALAAPHSIAVMQAFWMTGALFWLIRIALKPRPRISFSGFGIALFAYWLWSLISSIFSYAPDISLDKMRGVSLLILLPYALANIRSLKALKLLAGAIIFSTMVVVFWTPIDRLLGRGVEVQGIRAESLLRKIDVRDGTTIVKANKKKVTSPEQLLEIITANEETSINYFRDDYYVDGKVYRGDLLAGDSALEKLGFTSWKKSHVWRSAGFYGHYTTFAEVLQIVGSLVFGLLIGGVAILFRNGKLKDLKNVYTDRGVQMFALCVLMIGVALLLTVTRASQIGFAVAAIFAVVLSGQRKLLIVMILALIPVGIAGMLVLERNRNVTYFDQKDNSILWRQTVWREGFDLWTSSPRNFTVGVGMDSIKRYAKEWHLFDDGRLPSGHFHSTPLQLAVERGFPALILWYLAVFLLLRELWTAISVYLRRTAKDLTILGVLIGSAAAVLGFSVGGLTHNNIGDAEVVMVLYFIVALGLKALRFSKTEDQLAFSML